MRERLGRDSSSTHILRISPTTTGQRFAEQRVSSTKPRRLDLLPAPQRSPQIPQSQPFEPPQKTRSQKIAPFENNKAKARRERKYLNSLEVMRYKKGKNRVMLYALQSVIIDAGTTPGSLSESSN